MLRSKIYTLRWWVCARHGFYERTIFRRKNIEEKKNIARSFYRLAKFEREHIFTRRGGESVFSATRRSSPARS